MLAARRVRGQAISKHNPSGCITVWAAARRQHMCKFSFIMHWHWFLGHLALRSYKVQARVSSRGQR